MKVEFDDKNNMSIIPETWKDDEQLKQFYHKHKTNEVRKCIIFNRRSDPPKH